MVDLEAYTDYAGAASSGSSSLLDGDAAAVQQLEQGVAEGGAASQQRAAGAAAASSKQLRAGWMTSDLSVLLADNYRAYMEAVVLSAELCDVTAAAALRDAARSCRLLYNSAAYLSTIAHSLNIPVEVQQGVQYCYPLPSAAGAAPRQHCQSYMPEMAYHGIVTGYNRHGARIHLVGSAYHDALLEAAGLPAGSMPAATAAVKPDMPAAGKQPQEVPVGAAAEGAPGQQQQVVTAPPQQQQQQQQKQP
ncbi:hypothetical protein COO60DRAFT_1514018 [Scenedesmus sp. NREL 46B-D3]|nr:hypothetical protein COO60DRAFT_1514018 [Scenedesmus sp. NREL 46B-D3]